MGVRGEFCVYQDKDGLRYVYTVRWRSVRLAMRVY